MKKSIKTVSVCLLVVSMLLSLCGCSKSDFGLEEGTYTVRYAANSLPTSWNNHTYQSNDATYIIDYTEDALYTFDYNDTKDGYKIVPSMAAEMPKDVTSEYVGKFGITDESVNQVYEIALKHTLKYDNGDPITAKEFIESAKRLMNPVAANYRSDNFYSGNLTVYNAENYVKQGSYGLKEFVSANYGDDEYVDPKDFKQEADGHYTYEGKDIILDITSGGNWGSNSLADYAGAKYLPEDTWKILTDAADDNGWVKLNATTLKATQDCIAVLHGYDSVEAYAAKGGDYAYIEFEEMAFFGMDFPKVEFSEVGYFAKDDYTLVIALTKPLAGFYLNYSLCSNMNLVHIPTYDACESIEDGVYHNDYGTGVLKYVGYGPYKLTRFIMGNKFTLEKNEFWHGYSEPEHAGQYQTTAIQYTQVSEAATRLEMFLKGELESYGLQKADMDDYQSSDFCYYTEGDSTWFIALNPDEAALKEVESTTEPKTKGNAVVKRILCIKEFRQALSFSVDRAAYELALDPTGSPAKALYGNMIIYDPEAGLPYRTTQEAKEVIANFWGLGDSYGEGKEYATIEDAIDSITGYDLAGAKELFNIAYEKAVEAGYIPSGDNWEVDIMIGQPGSGSSAYYNDGYVLLSQVWTDAVKGTKLEGHMNFDQSQPLGSTNFSDYLKNNQIDLLFGVGWTGSALDPYGLIEAYCKPSYQYDNSIDYTKINATFSYEGKKYTASVDALCNCLAGEPTVVRDENDNPVTIAAGSSADIKLRLAILAAMEGQILQQYTMIPVGLDASASLKCMRVKYYTEEYVFGMGRGGIQYMTFTMDDYHWAQYVKEQGGKLNYK